MLVLSRKRDESILIGDGLVTVTVIDIRGDAVRLGFDADPSIVIDRKEVFETKQRNAGQVEAGPQDGA